MSSKKISKRTNSKDSTILLNNAVDVFTFLIMCLFPLFVMDRYYDILPAKYHFYIASVLFLLVFLLVVGFMDKNRVRSYFASFKMRDFIRRFSATDIALLSFLIIAGISTASSDYVYESFWGNEGRYSGFFLLSLYGIAYFCVTRFGRMRKWYLDAFLIANMLVCLFGITDYFKMDILHFKIGMLEEQKYIFTSSIGNINTYTALVGMVAAVSAVLFAKEDKWIKRCFYYMSLIVSFFAIIMGISDNAYLSLGVLFGLLPLYLFDSKRGVRSYLLILVTFFSVIQCIGWINIGMGDKVVGIDSAFNMIVQFDGLFALIILLWALFIGSYGFDCYMKRKNKKMLLLDSGFIKKHERGSCYMSLRMIWLALLIISMFVLGFIILDANVLGNAKRYQAFAKYVVFNDDWGTHRGYIWRNAIECFNKFPLIKKIIGFGPDTFGIMLLEKTKDNIYGETFDNAHNEYLHYLVTLGITGLAAYLAFLFSFIIRVLRNAGDNKYIVAGFFAVSCYCIQAFVNLNLPIATPIMWMFLMLGETEIRRRLNMSYQIQAKPSNGIYT